MYEIKGKDSEECLGKGLENVIHFTALKDGTKLCCKTCPGTKEFAEKNEAKCYIDRRAYQRFLI